VQLSSGETAPSGNVRFGSKADIGGSSGNVRFTPKSGHSALRQRLLFDHLVGGGEQFGWDVEAECPRGIEVDYKFKLR
jgi:hypothetical protein